MELDLESSYSEEESSTESECSSLPSEVDQAPEEIVFSLEDELQKYGEKFKRIQKEVLEITIEAQAYFDFISKAKGSASSIRSQKHLRLVVELLKMKLEQRKIALTIQQVARSVLRLKKNLLEGKPQKPVYRKKDSKKDSKKITKFEQKAYQKRMFLQVFTKKTLFTNAYGHWRCTICTIYNLKDTETCICCLLPKEFNEPVAVAKILSKKPAEKKKKETPAKRNEKKVPKNVVERNISKKGDEKKVANNKKKPGDKPTRPVGRPRRLCKRQV